jgi:beta-lactamase regulating signal transducer with metallopeptidase domain/protocatechuate 3,4-dioxygenase beta subunit
MNLLARLDPGDAVTRAVVVALMQTSVVILSAALLSRFALSRRAEAKHVVWLGVLVWVLISPGVAAVAEGSGLAFWVVELPIPAVGTSITDAVITPSPRDERGAGTGQALTSRAEPSEGQPTPAPGSQEGDEWTLRPRDERQARSIPTFHQSTATRRSTTRGNAVAGAVVLIWAAGALVGFVRIARGWRRLAATSRATQPLDPVRHGPTLERVRDVLGIAVLPPVVVSSAARGPVAVGFLRPRVMMPEGLAESISSDVLRDVLVHECAHVLRLDAWVGLLQRLAAVVFWPHPLVHYLNGQLERAREEVCDNHVLRCGDRFGYARTLLALTEQCRPLGVARPGLGLLGDRWTLADRVAGLLDPRRIPMTGTTIRMKIAVAIAIGVTGLVGSTVRFDRPARADEVIEVQTDPKAVAPAAPKDGVWSIEGIVVDEQGRPVPGAVVHAEEEADPIGGKTAPDGTFMLWMRRAPLYTRMLVAEADGGARLGLVRFQPARPLAAKDPVRLSVKPARTVRVRVRDAAGAPVAGAAVEGFEYGYQFHAATGSDGVASLRVPADASIRGVIGLKLGAGFDYFENYRTTPPDARIEFPPLPAEITLTLDGAQAVRIKVVGPDGRPMPGVVLAPWRPSKSGKIETMDISRGATTRATTDAQGVAIFDWLPKAVPGRNPAGGVRFFIRSVGGNYHSEGDIRYVPGGPTDLTVRLRLMARLSGTVRYPDGRPARQVLVIAALISRGFLPVGARTDDEGKYVFDHIMPGTSRMIAVNDETWAAPSLTSNVLEEGQEQAGLDFTLIKGTLIHGRVTEGPDRHPVANSIVSLQEEGGLLPKPLRTVSANTYHLGRGTYTDSQGRYQIRVGPGRYLLRTADSDGDESPTIEVKDEAEIVRDLATNGSVRGREAFLKGLVVEKTATGERPVAGALAFRWPVLGSRRTDEEGKFLFEQTPGETIAYAYCPEKSLAGFSRLLPANADNVKVVLSPTATVTGRVIDSNGKPRAGQRVGVRLASGSARRFEFPVSAVVTDHQGRFTYKDAPPGSTGEFVVTHEREDLFASGPHTVVPFEVRDPDPIQVADLIVPPERPDK